MLQCPINKKCYLSQHMHLDIYMFIKIYILQRKSLAMCIVLVVVTFPTWATLFCLHSIAEVTTNSWVSYNSRILIVRQDQ